ncbi:MULTISPECIES: hypothetical protein [Clostridium]|uniref:Uncharacterized protein n=1 Tax=Clostridium cibarium TaxID=2762247 RepID=A0ABR8PPT2_9CLOT|nr:MULTISPECIES: hypothetical protein [Clostridium]MBD7910168.1 hypothetical protein [Clostridium cibarium]
MKVVAKPIEMVAWFEKCGKVNPIKFRIEEDSEVFIIVKIEKVVKRENERLAGNPMHIFTCTGIINGVEKIFQLKYEINTCKWLLFKI